ncbi:MAG: flagellar hook-associated protein FlgK [Proteobacteria bacterium]|nr:flagellar hook-associated protein FlgK [Pseudomonadota bacterium]
MSLGLALTSSVSGLLTTQSGLNTVATNISNVNTEGYTRKTASQETVILGGMGAGVQISEITRTVDQYLLRTLRTETSKLGEFRVLDDFFDRTQVLFGQPGDHNSISALINGLATAVEALATEPEKAAPQLSVVDAARRLARELNTLTTRIQDLRYEADRQIKAAVDIVNTQLSNIADINIKIVREKALDRPAGDLEDQRDRALAIIAEYMDIRSFERSDGNMVILSGSGQTLLDGDAVTLTHTPVSSMQPGSLYDSADPVGGTVKGIFVGSVAAANDITGSIDSGRIAALVEMRDRHLVNLQDQLAELASQLTEEINTLHNQGAGLPPAQTLTGTRTGLTLATTIDPDSGAGTYGSIRIAITDTSGVLDGAALDLDLDALHAALVADAVIAGGDPLTVEHIVNALNGEYAATGSLALSTPIDGLPQVVDAASGGLSGDFAAVQNGRLVVSTSSGFGIAIDELDSTIDDGGTSRGLSMYFGLNDFFTYTDSSNIAGTLAVRSDIVTQPSLFSRGALQEEPAGSGTFYLGAGDDSIVRQIAAKFEETLSFPLTGELPASTQTFENLAAQIVANNAKLADDASRDFSFQERLQETLKYKSDSFSGVNLDEEMALMVQLEQAYNASARMIQVVNEMFDELVNIVR